jgi:hypothetical protein
MRSNGENSHQTSMLNAVPTLLVACLAIVLPLAVNAGSVTVTSAEANIINEMVVIDAHVNYEFSDDALDALRSGIALFIDVDFRIKRQRRFIWDRKVLNLSRRYRFERHALTDRYVITDLVTSDRRIYDSLNAAIADLGQIQKIPVAENSDFDVSMEYKIGLRARLDLESLPAPIRPIAYISPSWRMSSGWYQWTLAR